MRRPREYAKVLGRCMVGLANHRRDCIQAREIHRARPVPHCLLLALWLGAGHTAVFVMTRMVTGEPAQQKVPRRKAQPEPRWPGRRLTVEWTAGLRRHTR